MFKHKKQSLQLQIERRSRQSGYHPALTQKRLGDGFYEQRLIREQIAQLTGRRFLTGYANDEAQYQAIMTNGVTFAQAHQLVPGVALSAAQVAQLTSDIVWLVAQTVTLPDGSQTQALVPQVYARLQAGDINDAGSLLAGETLHLNVTGDAINSGTLSGRQLVNLNADNLHNLGGVIQGQQVGINANQDINNLGGTFAAQQALTLMAGRDINISSTTQSSNNTAQSGKVAGQLGYASRTGIDRVAGLYITDAAQGILVASAGNDFNLTAAQIQNAATQGTTTLTAANDLQLNTLQTSENLSAGTAKRYVKHQITEDVGSSINAANDITLNANHNINIKAAKLESSQGDLTLNAGSNVTITTGIADSRSEQYSKKKSSGFMSSSKKVKQNIITDSNTIASNLSAENITINAADNLNVKGSNIVATQTVNLVAQNDINLESAQDLHTESHLYKKQKTGFTASSTSIGYGSSKLKTTNNNQQVTNVGSTVGSIEGDVNINAGLGGNAVNNTGTYTQTGSDILTPQGDINITAQQVNIINATDTYANQQSMKYKQTGVTLAVTSPVISAIQTVNQMSKAAGKTDDPRMQALAAGTAALAANNAKDAIIAGNTPKLDENGLQVLDANGNNTAENPANQVGGINVSLSIGTSKSSSKTTQTNSSAKSSILNAGGNVTVTAVRHELVEGQTSEASNINVIGSTIKAANDVTLKADDQINLQAAQNVDTLNSKNKGSSASLGVSFGSDGFLVTAGLSGSKGKTRGNGSTWTETQVQGGNHTGDTVTLESGTDTTLKGAQVIGNQVIANVGNSGKGNLNIQSLQDTNQYKDKQQSIGGSVSVGYGKMGGSFNYSDSKTKSNYASVNEQSGIMAGDGGFQVNVNGNTNLTGAVIASTDKAIQDNKNSLTTQTLTVSSIENKAEYEANAKGISIGGGTQSGKPTLSGAGIGSDSGDASSTTVSGISGGTVSITDSSQQSVLTGKDTTTTVALLNRDVKVNENGEVVDSAGNATANTLAPIFDAEKVAKEIQAQVQITQAFGQQADQAVSTYVQTQKQPLREAYKNATTDVERAAIQAQFDDLILQGRVMNVLISAVTGLAGSALAQETLSLAAAEMHRISVENSMKSVAIVDAYGNVVSNLRPGEENKLLQDKDLGGTRLDPDGICGLAYERCKKQENADGTPILDTNGKPQLAYNDQGRIQFTYEPEGQKLSIYDFLDNTDEGKKMHGLTGGIQGGTATFAGYTYPSGGIVDQVIKAFGGTHDLIGGQVPGLYNDNGDTRQGMTEAELTAHNTWSAVAILPSAPFAMAQLMSPEMWKAISVMLGAAK